MLKNFFKIALRNLFKNKAHTFLNVFGLAIGIACCILIMLFVQDELSFDKFHSKQARIFRVVEERLNPDGSKSVVPLSNGLIGETAENQLPQVEESVRIINRSATGRFTVEYGDKKFYSGDHIFTSPDFFTLFDFELIEGDKKTVLSDPSSIIITETAKEKYFGDEEALGKTLSVEGRGDVKVAGIMKNPPHNSHLQFDLIFPIEILLSNEGWRNWINSWKSEWITTYVLVKPDYNEEEMQSAFKRLGEEHFSESEINERTIFLQHLHDIHFFSGEMENEYLNANAGDESYIYILSIVALFILLIACINFMNLSTAKSFDRAKEVGLRKVMGAFRTNILRQFLGESLIISFISLLFSIVIIELLFPLFNSLTGKDISTNYLENWPYVLSIISLAFIVGIISGSYPAFYISKFQPVKVLKGIQKSSKKGYSFRQILVVVQFALSIIMIVSTVVVYQQLEFIRDKRLGFHKDNMIVVDINSGSSRSSFREIKSEMLRSPSVKNVTTSSRVPGEWKNLPQVKVQASGSEVILQPYHITIDEDFIDTYSLELISGRNFSEKMGTDSSSVIINETAAKLFGWDDPLGKIIRMPDEEYSATIVGVVKDFHVESLHQKISPVILGYLNTPYMKIDYYSIRTDNADISEVLSHLKDVHEKFDKVTPFEYNFLDERLNDFYINDQRMGKLFGIAALLSIFIACLGLFALSSFMTKVRTKEIGIRKILGSSIGGIVLLLSKDSAKWIVIANIAAWPVAYFAMNKWLEDFAYRTEITIWAFVATGSAALVIAFLTIGFQAVKAALANPVKSLRYE
jgi:putative ABC transport system permease protein